MLVHFIGFIRKHTEQIRMSYYEPFYYPYYSARVDLPPVFGEIDERIERIKQEEKYRSVMDEQEITRKNEEMRLIEIENNQRITREIAEFNSLMQKQAFEAQLESRYQMRRLSEIEENDIANRIEKLRLERELLDRVSGPIGRFDSAPFPQPFSDPILSDDELVRYYQSGSRMQQYQRQLRERYIPQQIDRSILIKDNHRPELFSYSQDEPVSANHRYSQRKSPSQRMEDSLDRKSAEPAQRSYVQNLKTSKDQHDQTTDTRINKYGNDNRGQTLDIRSKYDQQSPLKLKYEIKQKKKESKRNNRSVMNSSKRRKINSRPPFNLSNLTIQKNVTYSDLTINSALKKISNRLKVSSIVYKDSKLRNNRHQINHLFNTFENELKGRKQIRDKLNNHPIVLKRHNLVADSR